MQSILVLLAIVSAKSLDQLCTDAKDAGMDFISVKLPLTSPGITDCKGGKCLPSEDTATDCKLYLEYTHPDNSAIADNFAQDYTTAVANKRPFDGIHFITNIKNREAVNYYINRFTTKARKNGLPGNNNILTASYAHFLADPVFFENKKKYNYAEIFFHVAHVHLQQLDSSIEIIDGARLVTLSDADADAVEAAYPGEEVYVRSNADVTDYPGLTVCP